MCPLSFSQFVKKGVVSLKFSNNVFQWLILILLFNLKGYYNQKKARLLKQNSLLASIAVNASSTDPNSIVIVKAQENAAEAVETVCKADRNATLMIIVMCSMSFVSHLFSTTATIYPLVNPGSDLINSTTLLLYALSKIFF